MKMSTIDIASECSTGAMSVVLYDTQMMTGAALGSLSLLMKGEVLAESTNWQGNPARRANPEALPAPAVAAIAAKDSR